VIRIGDSYLNKSGQLIEITGSTDDGKYFEGIRLDGTLAMYTKDGLYLGEALDLQLNQEPWTKETMPETVFVYHNDTKAMYKATPFSESFAKVNGVPITYETLMNDFTQVNGDLCGC
jgi:hypothetical protein